jgi:hypothetical protein
MNSSIAMSSEVETSLESNPKPRRVMTTSGFADVLKDS